MVRFEAALDARGPVSILVVASALGAWAGIRAERAATPHEESPAAVEPPVPAPADLVAEAVVASPDATWRKIQLAVGGPLVLAPPTFREILGATTGVTALRTLVDGSLPAYAVLGSGGRWVVAARVVSAQRARSTLESTQAPTLHFDSRAGSIDVLAGTGVWVGVAGTFVLVGSDRDAVVSLGPYAYRTLPTRPASANDVAATASHAALAGPIRAMLERKWNAVHAWLFDQQEKMRSAKQGHAPEVGDPTPVLAELDSIERTYADRLVSMDRADLALDLDDDGARARLTLVPPPAGEARKWVDDLEGSSAAPLLAARAGSLATVFWRNDPSDRLRTAKETSETLARVLGDRLPAADETKIGAALERIATARGGWALASVNGGAETGALVRFATNDAPAIDASLASLCDLARQPTWAKWESDAFGLTKVDRVGSRATFSAEQGTLQADWESRPGQLDLAVGMDAQAVLSSGSGQVTLASDAKVAAWLSTLHAAVVFVVVGRPLLLAASPRSDPAMLGLLHGNHVAVLDARVPGVVLRELGGYVRSW